MDAENVEEQRLLAGIVVIEQRLRHPAGRGHFRHRRAVVTVLSKQGRRTVEDRTALDVVIGGTGAGHQAFGLLSITRRALPAERSTAPGSPTSTFMPMPILLRIWAAS